MTGHVPTHVPTQVLPQVLAPDLPPVMVEQITRLREAGKSASTRRAYVSDWSRFSSWCETHNLTAIPAHPDTVSAYLADQVQTVKVSTLRRHVATISKAHQVAGLPDPCKTAALADTLAGLRREHGAPANAAAGLLADDLKRTLDSMGDTLSDLRDRALLLVGWCAGLRRSEIARLTWGDIVSDPDGVLLVLRHTKTDKTGQGRTVGLARDTTTQTGCPVTALAKWRAVLYETAGSSATLETAPVFVQINRHGQTRGALSGQAVAQIVERRTLAAGLPIRYRGHSLRKGLVMQAKLSGVDIDRVMATTGHTSPVMVLRYQGEAGKVSRAAHIGLLA